MTKEELRGSWVNPLVTVTFGDDGVATVIAFGGVRRTGHWEIDSDGRLLTDATGKMEPAGAQLSGRHLTVTIGGRRLAFTRA